MKEFDRRFGVEDEPEDADLTTHSPPYGDLPAQVWRACFQDREVFNRWLLTLKVRDVRSYGLYLRDARNRAGEVRNQIEAERNGAATKAPSIFFQQGAA